MSAIRALVIVAALCSLGLAQNEGLPAIVLVRPNQQVLVPDLHLHVAIRAEPADTLAAALETVIANPGVCCGKKSTFSEVPDWSETSSLSDVGARLGGRHVLSDGRPFNISAQYWPSTALTSHALVRMLMRDDHLLVQWNSRVFLVQGVTFDDRVYSDGSHDYVLRKLLLLDPSLANKTHQVTFDREKDDWSKVEGFLLLKIS